MAKFTGHVLINQPMTYYEAIATELTRRHTDNGEFTATQLVEEIARWRTANVRGTVGPADGDYYERQSGPGVRNGITDTAVMTSGIVAADGAVMLAGAVRKWHGEWLTDKVILGVAADVSLNLDLTVD